VRLTRVTLLLIALILVAGFWQLARYQLEDVEPQTFQPVEEVMVDTAHVLAELVEADLQAGRAAESPARDAIARAGTRRFEAKIHNHLKTRVGLGAYLTDNSGIVVFDSQGRRTGMDYSGRRDVALTLRGEYGARSSRENDDDPGSSVMYVAAPVGDAREPLGVLTVYKAQADTFPIIRSRRRAIQWGIGLVGSGVILLVAAVFAWVFHPIGRLTGYARAIERGERPPLPKLGVGREVNTLASALESMREAIEGRRFAERYIHTLTHEMKSPLAAIRGAAELLDEEMPPANRRRFLENIRGETARTERMINRLLELAAIESKARLEQSEEFDFCGVVRRALDQAEPLAEVKNLVLDAHLPADSVPVRGDSFILRAAVTNLLENAIDFSPSGATVTIDLTRCDDHAVLHIDDRGPGIPDYAREKVFERFYSLRHHQSGRKGTGLGLTLVKEAAELHGGSIRLEPLAHTGGTRAVLALPLSEKLKN
jgi:two-component system sensor histidine kinase CreC